MSTNSAALDYLLKLKQLEREIYDLELSKDRAERTIKSLERSKEDLEKQLAGKLHSDREREQEKMLLLEINKLLQNNTNELEGSKNELEKKLSEQNKTLKELSQEKAIVTEITNYLRNAMPDLEQTKEELEKQLSEKSHSDKEREQERLLILEVNRILLGKIEELQKSKDHLEQKIDGESKSFKELKQERLILSEIAVSEKTKRKKMYKKYYLSIVIIAITVSATFSGYSYYQNQVLIETTKVLLENYNSKYVIQNLKGDTVDTWISWRLADGRSIDVNIVNTAGVSDEVIDAIKDSIISTEGIELDDSLLHKGPPGSSSTYYKGWSGALEKASLSPTIYYIPRKFNVIDSPTGAGQIIITLVKQKDPDGYSGFTQSITDNNQILKSSITIYEADKITKEQMGAIIRHEFGHALGLAHSTAPEDLMAPIIKTEYPYISDCDIDAVRALYDGKKTSQVVCEK